MGEGQGLFYGGILHHSPLRRKFSSIKKKYIKTQKFNTYQESSRKHLSTCTSTNSFVINSDRKIEIVFMTVTKDTPLHVDNLTICKT